MLHMKRKQYKPSAIGRFLVKMKLNPERIYKGSPCWEWEGAIDKRTNYGRFSSPGESYAHRFAYAYFIGKPPDDHDVHHDCENRRCVSPLHLKAITHQHNTLLRSRKPNCVNGHDLAEHGYINKYGHQYCRICLAVNAERYREKKRRLKASDIEAL